jgi:hypothetical protein
MSGKVDFSCQSLQLITDILPKGKFISFIRSHYSVKVRLIKPLCKDEKWSCVDFIYHSNIAAVSSSMMIFLSHLSTLPSDCLLNITLMLLYVIPSQWLLFQRLFMLYRIFVSAIREKERTSRAIHVLLAFAMDSNKRFENWKWVYGIAMNIQYQDFIFCKGTKSIDITFGFWNLYFRTIIHSLSRSIRETLDE